MHYKLYFIVVTLFFSGLGLRRYPNGLLLAFYDYHNFELAFAWSINYAHSNPAILIKRTTFVSSLPPAYSLEFNKTMNF